MQNVEVNLLKKLIEDMRFLKNDIKFIKHIIAEEYELNDSAKDELRTARATPKDEFIGQEEMEKEFL